jgi:hypothetical protein
MPRASADFSPNLFDSILATAPKLDPRRVGFMDAAMQGDAQDAALLAQQANNEAAAEMQAREIASANRRFDRDLKQRRDEFKALGRSRIGDRAGAIAGAVDAASGLQSSGGQILRNFESFLKGQPSLTDVGINHLKNANAMHSEIAPFLQPTQALQASIMDPELWRIPSMPRLPSS